MATTTTVAYCFDRNWARYAAVSTHTLFRNARTSVKVYWIVPAEDIDSIGSLVALFKNAEGSRVDVVGVENNVFAGWKISGHLARATYLRLLLPQHVPDHKVIYVDADTLILSDLSELYTIELGSNLIGGALDLDGARSSRVPRDSADPYINGGVLLMNLEALRKDRLLERSIAVHEKFKDGFVWADQCLLNKYAEGKKLVFDAKWNRLIVTSQTTGSQFSEARSNSAILHFIGSVKPWQRWCNPHIFEFWWEYARQLNIPDLAPQQMTTIQQALALAGVLDLNEMYRDSSLLKAKIIDELLEHISRQTAPR